LPDRVGMAMDRLRRPAYREGRPAHPATCCREGGEGEAPAAQDPLNPWHSPMKRQRLLWLLALALPVAGLSCAPVDDVPAKKVQARPADDGGAVPIPPAPGLPRDLQALQQRVRAAIENVRRRELLVTYSF